MLHHLENSSGARWGGGALQPLHHHPLIGWGGGGGAANPPPEGGAPQSLFSLADQIHHRPRGQLEKETAS